MAFFFCPKVDNSKVPFGCSFLVLCSGGKIEEGETPQEALIREIKDELETDITLIDKIKAAI